MNEENKRTYPCDEAPVRRVYPCDEAPAADRTYPCDETPAADRTYPGDASEKTGERRTAGKGRRGGNSAMSIVIRSEKKKTGDEENAERSEHSSRGRSFARNGQGGRQDSFARGRQGNRRDSFRRDGQSVQEDGFRRRGQGDWGDSFRRREQSDRQDGFRRNGQSDRRNDFRRSGQSDRGDSFRRSEQSDRQGSFRGNGYERRERNGFHAQEVGIEDFDSPRELCVLQNTSIGSFLDLGNGDKVLLPFAEQTERPAEGENVRVYLYRDKGSRLTATMRTPILKTGELGVLKVAEITRIGIFLDNGMPKQLLVPFKEQICTPKPGGSALVYLYRDKSGRQAATMRVYQHLSNEAPYHAEDRAEGFVYEVNPDIGVFVAVDNRYFGLIPKAEVYENYRYGQTVSCRVLRVREDGKLDLAVREKSYAAIEQDAEAVLAEIRKQGGKLPYADKADAKLIEETYHMSKNQFKRALGSLYRERKVAIDRGQDTVTLLQYESSAAEL